MSQLVETINPVAPISLVSAAGKPGINDDIDKGYLVGSQWVDTSNGDIYSCVDNTSTAAVWLIIGAVQAFSVLSQHGATTWLAKTITVADLVGIAVASEAIDLLDLTGTSLVVLDAFCTLKTNFTGGGVATCTASIGRAAGAANSLVLAGNVFAGAPKIFGNVVGDKGAETRSCVGALLESPIFIDGPAGDTLQVTITVDTTTDALTAGEMTVYMCVAKPATV